MRGAGAAGAGAVARGRRGQALVGDGDVPGGGRAPLCPAAEGGGGARRVGRDAGRRGVGAGVAGVVRVGGGEGEAGGEGDEGRGRHRD